MIIKKLRKKDISQLYKLGLEEFKDEFWFTKKFLEETINTPGYYYGAMEKNKLIGGILVKKWDRPKFWIFFFIVDKNYRRKGIGHKLLKTIESKCSKDYLLLFVDFEKSDIEALKFYTKNGFEKQAEIKDWYGVNQEGIIYSKRLKSN